MSRESYARGFCKCAIRHGVNPGSLVKFAYIKFPFVSSREGIVTELGFPGNVDFYRPIEKDEADDLRKMHEGIKDVVADLGDNDYIVESVDGKMGVFNVDDDMIYDLPDFNGGEGARKLKIDADIFRKAKKFVSENHRIENPDRFMRKRDLDDIKRIIYSDKDWHNYKDKVPQEKRYTRPIVTLGITRDLEDQWKSGLSTEKYRQKMIQNALRKMVSFHHNHDGSIISADMYDNSGNPLLGKDISFEFGRDKKTGRVILEDVSS